MERLLFECAVRAALLVTYSSGVVCDASQSRAGKAWCLGCSGLIDPGAADLDGVETKGAAARAAAVGAENCKRGYSFGRHSFKYLPLLDTCFDLASHFARVAGQHLYFLRLEVHS
jgi:hypothetical protein